MSSATIAKQKRMLTQPNSQLGKVDLVEALDNEMAWMTLPEAVRRELYSQLPAPKAGASPHDIDQNPLHSALRPYIEDAIANWQYDLREGRESKKWRQEAIETGKERESGKFDEYSIAHKEEWWGDAESDDTEETKDDPIDVAPATPGSDAIRDAELSSSSRPGAGDRTEQEMGSPSDFATVEGRSIPMHIEQQTRISGSTPDRTIEAENAATNEIKDRTDDVWS